jgi:hypothetical protein
MPATPWSRSTVPRCVTRATMTEESAHVFVARAGRSGLTPGLLVADEARDLARP